MPLEGRRRQVNERSEETPSAHSSGEEVATKLLRIAEKAKNEPKFQFTSLFHLMDKGLLRRCFAEVKRDKAAGIDEVTKEEYGQDLEGNLTKLVERLHRLAYIPQPVRRVYIPKPGSNKQRPLGIPTVSAYCTSYNAASECPRFPLWILIERWTHASNSCSFKAQSVIQ